MVDRGLICKVAVYGPAAAMEGASFLYTFQVIG